MYIYNNDTHTHPAGDMIATHARDQYGVASVSRIQKIIGLFFKRAL